MIRIIFDDGGIVDCKHIVKMYVEEAEMEKVTIVGNIKALEEEDVQLHNTVAEEEE